MDDTALVKVNLDFSNKRTKFKITATLQKESPQEVKMFTVNRKEFDF